jgi:hypothetical protein
MGPSRASSNKRSKVGNTLLGRSSGRRRAGGQTAGHLVELGFADVESYLRVRRVGQGRSLRRMLAELQVGSAWLKDQMNQLHIP